MVQGQLQPGLRLVAEVRQCHRHGDVDGGEQPEEDYREEAADREDDEGGSAVHDGSEEEQQAKEGEGNIFAVSCKNLGKRATLDGLI